MGLRLDEPGPADRKKMPPRHEAPPTPLPPAPVRRRRPPQASHSMHIMAQHSTAGPPAEGEGQGGGGALPVPMPQQQGWWGVGGTRARGAACPSLLGKKGLPPGLSQQELAYSCLHGWE